MLYNFPLTRPLAISRQRKVETLNAASTAGIPSDWTTRVLKVLSEYCGMMAEL